MFGLVFLFAAIALGAIAPAASDTQSEGLRAPAVISVRADDIWRTLEGASWVSARDPSVKANGKIVYAITFRSCPTCAAFKAAEYDGLMKSGVEVRWIMYARRDRDGKPRSKPGERAMIAELWLRRDKDLLNAWWAAEDLDSFYVSSAVPPAAEGDPRRQGALAQSRALVDRLSGLLKENSLEMAIPALIWREAGKTKVYIGYTSEGFAPGRAFLTAP